MNKQEYEAILDELVDMIASSKEILRKCLHLTDGSVSGSMKSIEDVVFELEEIEDEVLNLTVGLNRTYKLHTKLLI